MNPATMLGTGVAALLNSLWQGAGIALPVWALQRLLTRMNVRINAATRCAMWWAVLAVVVLLPFAPPSARDVATSSRKSFVAAAPGTPVAPQTAATAAISPAPLATAPMTIPPITTAPGPVGHRDARP